MHAQVLARTREMSHTDWLKLRRLGIGGSDAAAIAGLNPYRSPIAVYLEKVGGVEPEEAGEAAYWGTALESIVAQEFATRTGLKVTRRHAILQHPEHPFMLGNVDRIIYDPERGRGVLECKTTNAWRAGDWDDDRVPDAHYLQVQHYLAVTGLEYGYLAVLIGGNRYLQQYIERDDEVIRDLVTIESDFWERVQAKTPPPLDGTAASTALIGKLYPESTPGLEVALPPTALDLIRDYERAKEEEKAAGTRADAAANQLKSLLADAEIGFVDDRKVSWKTVTSNRLDSKALKAAHPGIYTQYTKPSISRRFEVK